MERAESAFERVSDAVKFTLPEALFIAPERLESLLEPFHVVEFDGGTTFPNRVVIDWT